MSARAIRNIRLAVAEVGQERETAKTPAHTLVPFGAVERCGDCGRRLAPGQHELCPRCDARLDGWVRHVAGRQEAFA